MCASGRFSCSRQKSQRRNSRGDAGRAKHTPSVPPCRLPQCRHYARPLPLQERKSPRRHRRTDQCNPAGWYSRYGTAVKQSAALSSPFLVLDVAADDLGDIGVLFLGRPAWLLLTLRFRVGIFQGDELVPPRVRGTPMRWTGTSLRCRFIPARAGNAPTTQRRGPASAVHPRACGECCTWDADRAN
jgi:hypothetical protein